MRILLTFLLLSIVQSFVVCSNGEEDFDLTQNMYASRNFTSIEQANHPKSNFQQTDKKVTLLKTDYQVHNHQINCTAELIAIGDISTKKYRSIAPAKLFRTNFEHPTYLSFKSLYQKHSFW